MSIGRHRYVEIKDGDLVTVVTTPSIAKEAVVARVENMIYQRVGIVKLITSRFARVWSRKRTGLAVDDQPSSS